jgi:hypothetical protein
MFEGSLWGALYPKKDAFYDLQKLLDKKKSILFLPLQNQNPSRPERLLRNCSPRTLNCDKSTLFSSRNPDNSQKRQ